MSSSSYRYGFKIPEHTQVALEILRGSQSVRRVTTDVGEIINLGSGDPSFITPPHVCEAAKGAIDAGKTHYERNQDLKDAICLKHRNQNGIHIDRTAGIVVTPGAHLALFDLMRAWIAPGDVVIMGTPGSYYLSNAMANGAVPVLVQLHPERRFKMDPADVARAITPQTKMICLTTPEAPAASVQEQADLAAIAELAIRHNLIVVSDELYEHINFGQTLHFSIGSIPGMEDRTITVNGCSKAWAMTGWRVGWAVGPETLIEPVRAINHLNCISLNSIAQFAALAALTGPQDFLVEACAEYKRKRDILVSGVKRITGLDCQVPEGSYYVWVDMRQLGGTSLSFSRFVFEHENVAFQPGTSFGPGGEGFLRFSFSPTEARLTEALERVERATRNWRFGRGGLA